jgi:hypothetical protein
MCGKRKLYQKLELDTAYVNAGCRKAIPEVRYCCGIDRAASEAGRTVRRNREAIVRLSCSVGRLT